MYFLGQYKFRWFVYPTSVSCVSHFVDICKEVIKNTRRMHAALTNQVVDALLSIQSEAADSQIDSKSMYDKF